MRKKKDTVVNPIYEWTSKDIWDYAGANKVPMNPLYPSLLADGYDRVGCVGCPLASFEKQKYDFNRWPQYKQCYIKAFDRMLEERRKFDKWKDTFKNGEDVMTWWLGDDPNQITIDQWLKETNK